MTPNFDWLPPLVLFTDYQGDWDKYIDAVYAYFKVDFIDSKPEFRGNELALKRHPVSEGKEATFWHLVQEGEIEDERTPELRRCERIRWPRPIVEHADETIIKVWENQRRGETRICIWLEEKEYLVILADRERYILFWTAYPVTREHTKRKLQREYDAFKRTGAA